MNSEEMNFENFIQQERTRIDPIVSACNLDGDWGNGYGPTPFDFWVDGPPPTRCPNCNTPLSESESIDSGDCNTEFWLSCDPCGFVWADGSAGIE